MRVEPFHRYPGLYIAEMAAFFQQVEQKHLGMLVLFASGRDAAPTSDGFTPDAAGGAISHVIA